MGLENAYAAGPTSYDPSTHSLYIKGTTTARDAWDDVTKIPFGDTARSERYEQAHKSYSDLMYQHKPVDRLVGHSLGGSVALELAHQLRRVGKHVQTRTFGAPVLDLAPRVGGHKPERYRHPFDPFPCWIGGQSGAN